VPEIGEYERASTTICNAYVLPVAQRYLTRSRTGCATSASMDRSI
jgi:N-methylhydantoinase A